MCSTFSMHASAVIFSANALFSGIEMLLVQLKIKSFGIHSALLFVYSFVCVFFYFAFEFFKRDQNLARVLMTDQIEIISNEQNCDLQMCVIGLSTKQKSPFYTVCLYVFLFLVSLSHPRFFSFFFFFKKKSNSGAFQRTYDFYCSCVCVLFFNALLFLSNLYFFCKRSEWFLFNNNCPSDFCFSPFFAVYVLCEWFSRKKYVLFG